MPLKHALSESLTLYRDRRFPYAGNGRPRYRYTAVIGVGGNVGDVRRRFIRLFETLRRRPGVEILRSAPILENPPFGFLDQAPFHNTVMELSTSMQPRAFLRFLWRLERQFGRKRSFPNAPRTLDLDILFFDSRVVATTELQIPHPHWHERQSVVIPLATLGSNR
jgi:2-amino-4-hydroxy-6-hydroxymethyldihydropteridine diphosphokinase